MTRLVVFKDGEHYSGFECTGHSGYAQQGEDIVCASVSVLLETLVSSIQDLTEDEISYDINYGDARLTYKDLSEKSRTLIDSFFIGCCGIVECYPEYARII